MNRRGSALIEFAGSLMLLGTMFAGIFQFGYNFYTYNRLVNAVRSGARYASLAGGTDPEFTKKVQNMVVYGDPFPSADASPVARGLTPENVHLMVDKNTTTVALRGFALDSMFSKINLDGRPTVTFPSATGVSK
jgi:Flp pilus assembly protein TadG